MNTKSGKFSDELKFNPEKRMSQLTNAIKIGDVEQVKALIRLDTALNRVLNAVDSNGQRSLHNAARFDQVETIVTLIELGAKMNARNTSFDTPLHVACKYGSLKSAATLAHLGANVDAKDSYNNTPLHAAAAEGRPQCIRLLILEGANPFAKTSTDIDYGNTPLHVAAWCGQTSSIKALLTPNIYHDTDIVRRLRDRKNIDRNTALHVAAIAGRAEAARCLVEKGSNMDAKGKHGRRPIHFAAIKGHPDVVRVLLDHGAVITARSGPEAPDFWQTPIHLAAFHGHIDVIDVLLAKEPRLINMRSHVHGQTPLHRAAANFQCDCVEALIARGADVNIVDDLGRTPLMITKFNKLDSATFRQADNRQRLFKLLRAGDNNNSSLSSIGLLGTRSRTFFVLSSNNGVLNEDDTEDDESELTNLDHE